MSAIFSDCRLYRLELRRQVDPLLGGPTAALIGVNPSIAGAEANDQTIRKDIGFARLHGWGQIIKVNKFARIATDVRQLAAVGDPVGPENDRYIEAAMREADVVIPCWGPLAKLPKRLRGRWTEIVAMADWVGKPLMCFGTANDGQPRHTLMLAYATPLVPWKRP